MTIPLLLDEAVKTRPDDLALDDTGKQWTWSELAADTALAAKMFAAFGLSHGGRVAIWAPNSAEWVIAAIGAQRAGAAIVPLNSRLKGPEAADIIRRSNATMLLTVNDFLGTDYAALIAGEDVPGLEHILPMERDAFRTKLEEHAEAAEPELTCMPDDIADIIFTSGTTGSPKGVLSSHSQNVRGFEAWGKAVGLREGDRYLIVNPFFHAFGYKAGWLACLIAGATILPEPVFDAARVAERIKNENITVMPGPPALFESILQIPGDKKLGGLRLAVTGAASVPPALIEKMRGELGIAEVLTGYGLTEASGIVSICSASDSAETVARSCGAPLPGVEVRLVDAEGNDVAEGEEGELLVRGFNVMQGYLDDEEATADAIDADGWLHTGDVAKRDERGYLTITDRMKDMFICGGFNAYPAEIEKIISGHPDIAQIAVIGMADERLGEVGRAFVVQAAGSDLTEEGLIGWCRDNMANYKVPRRIDFRDALPMNASGKVQKFLLEEEEESV